MQTYTHTHIHIGCVHPCRCSQIRIYIYIYMQIYTYTQTLTQTSPHGALLNQRHSSYAMSFHAMLCHAPSDRLSGNTIRAGFVPSSPTLRTLQTPHVGDFFLLQFSSAVRLRPCHAKDHEISVRNKCCRSTDLPSSTLGTQQHDIKSKGSSTGRILAAQQITTANAVVATMHGRCELLTCLQSQHWLRMETQSAHVLL